MKILKFIKKQNYIQGSIYLGSIFSIVLQYLRIQGYINIDLLTTLVPAFAPYVAYGLTLLIAFYSGLVEKFIKEWIN